MILNDGPEPKPGLFYGPHVPAMILVPPLVALACLLVGASAPPPPLPIVILFWASVAITALVWGAGIVLAVLESWAPQSEPEIQTVGERQIAYRAIYPDPLEAALYAIPGAVVQPPTKSQYSHGVIVATADEAFVATVRRAVRGVQGVDVFLIGGIVAPGEHKPWCGTNTTYVWAECWRDGELLGPEPRRQTELYDLRRMAPDYWLIRPAAAGPDDMRLGSTSNASRTLPDFEDDW